ncbi:hypothetical protein M569_15845, partial [Genlisea aurea]
DREQEEDSSTPTENTAESPLSGDEDAYTPLPKKSRRGANKRVVTVAVEGGDGYRSKGEVYPPPDNWSWRKYGQKPIKGSPYPRGYYRCSSSKGCPARKQVERSRHDPTTLVVTYSSDHNHPLPAAASAKTQVRPPAKPSSIHHHHPPEEEEEDNSPAAASAAEEPPPDNGFTELAGDFGWLCGVGPALMDEMTLVPAPAWAAAHADVEVFMPIGEEDKHLFGDLGDLPEYSVVFRRC